jgi:uncharacterized protein (DUF1684 family)
MRAGDAFDLLEWKREIFSLYAQVRAAEEPSMAWEMWRASKDSLFKDHPQSALTPASRETFDGLPYYDYDPSFRVIAHVEDVEPRRYEIQTSGDETMAFTRFGVAGFFLQGRQLQLEVYWLATYGGGIFLPFRDATSGKTTYGAGRYLLDTVKGADLGNVGTRLALDFNFAYNPSCAYDPRWVCPLAPPENRLEIAIEAGERYEN